MVMLTQSRGWIQGRDGRSLRGPALCLPPGAEYHAYSQSLVWTAPNVLIMSELTSAGQHGIRLLDKNPRIDNLVL